MEVGWGRKTQLRLMLLSCHTMTRNTLHTLVLLSVYFKFILMDTETPSIRHPASAQAGSASMPRLPQLLSTH